MTLKLSSEYKFNQLLVSSLGGCDEDPSADVGDGEEEEGLAAAELRAEVAGQEAAEDGADPEDAR